MRQLIVGVMLVVGCGDDSVHHLPDAGPHPDAPAIDAGIDHAPIAATGADVRALVGGLVTLAGSGADEDTGDVLTYAWTQTAGPTVELAGAATETPSFRARRVGTYTFSLTVSDGSMTSAPATVDVRIQDLNGGDEFTLSLETDGSLWAWGANDQGQLGNTQTASSGLPGRVCAPGSGDGADCAATPFDNVVAISTGASHSLALTADGKVWAWGYNGDGQLGTGNYDDARVPMPVCADATVAAADCAANQLSGIVAVSAGYLHSIALRSDGTLMAWGNNSDGELGNGSTIQGDFGFTPAPVCAPGATPPCTAAAGNILTDIAEVRAGGGGHTLALTTTGDVYAFGYNKSGQCGMGDASVRRQPLPVHVCANGQVAPCTEFLTNIVAVDAWSGSSLALDATGALWGWGGNDDGELGQVSNVVCLSAPVCNIVPAKVCKSYDSPCTTPLDDVVSFAVGKRYGMALQKTGALFAWGDDELGQLGNADGALASQLAPIQVCAAGQLTSPCTAQFTGAAAISLGSFHSMAVMPDGSIYAWGNNANGELGDNSLDPYHTAPGPVAAH